MHAQGRNPCMLEPLNGEYILCGDAGDLLPDEQLLKAGYDMRADVCKMMIERKDEIAPFTTGIFDAYVEAMALEGCWGGGPLVFSAKGLLPNRFTGQKSMVYCLDVKLV